MWCLHVEKHLAHFDEMSGQRDEGQGILLLCLHESFEVLCAIVRRRRSGQVEHDLDLAD